MTVRNAIAVIASLHERGVVRSYAITGAVAAINYIEPTLTFDLDVLVSIGAFEKRDSGLLLLGPIESALAEMGYTERSDVGVMVEGWPVQFIPVASPLDEAALAAAVETVIDGDPSLVARVLRAEFLVAKAISVGRLKDLARVDAFLDQEAVDLQAVSDLVKQFGLQKDWKAYCAKSGRPDPFGLD